MSRARNLVQTARAASQLTYSRTALACLLTSVAAFILLRSQVSFSSGDLNVYRAEGYALRSGADIYGILGATPQAHATYPPFAAMLFVPLTFIPAALMRSMGVALNILLLIAVSAFSCRLTGVKACRSSTVSCVLAAAALWSEPVFTTLRYGQINLLLLALVVWDFTRPASRRTRGVGIGIAAAIKVTPAIFIVYLLFTRRFRAAATATATLVAAIAASAAVAPSETWNYWTHFVFDVHRVGRLENAENQTLRGLMVRMDHTRYTTPGELLLIGIVFIAGLLCAVAAYRHLGDAWGVTACAITGLLTAPIAWTHHWVWCIPIAVLLWQQARGWLLAAAVFWTYAVWTIPHKLSAELSFSPLQIALSAWYIVFGAGFLFLVATRVWRAVDNQSKTRSQEPQVSSTSTVDQLAPLG